MKIKQIIKKALCLFVSALMLITSVPMQVLAQEIPSFTWYDGHSVTNNRHVMEEIIQKGYATEYETVAEVFRVIELNGGENFINYGKTGTYVAKKGDILVVDMAGNGHVVTREKFPRFYQKCPNMSDDFVMQTHQVVQLKRDIRINDEVILKGTWLEHDSFGSYRNYTSQFLRENGGTWFRVDEHMAEEVLANPPALTQAQLAELLRHDNGRLFGKVDTYAKFARIQATQAKGGEHIMTKLADGTIEVSDHVAKAGEWIVTNPGGEQYVVAADKFAKKYEAARELGEGWFKPKGAPQQFRRLNKDMVITASWGERQVLREGAYINVTDMSDLYGVAGKEFDDTYKTIKVMYSENFTRIERFLVKIEERLAAKHPKYKGVFFRRFLRNDTEFMKKALDEAADNAAKRIEEAEAQKIAKGAKKSTKRAINRTALRTFGGVVLGVGLYFAFTYLTADTVKGQNIPTKTHGEIIKDLEVKVDGIKEASEKGEIIENMTRFMDPGLYYVIKNDAIENDGKLLEEMGSIMPTIQATGMTEEEAAEVLVEAMGGKNAETTQTSERVATEIIERVNKPYVAPPLPEMLP